jgi:hypothetical protein
MSAPTPTRNRVGVRALGEDRWRLQCVDPRCPADVTKITSPGGAKQWAALHRAPDPDALVARALAEVGR